MRNRNAVILILAGLLVVQGFAKEKEEIPKCDELPRPENVIGAPPYASDNDCTQVQEVKEKLQYKAESNGTPYFDEKVSQSGIENGARYQKGQELFVDPDPGFTKTKEIIPDENEDILLAK